MLIGIGIAESGNICCLGVSCNDVEIAGLGVSGNDVEIAGLGVTGEDTGVGGTCNICLGVSGGDSGAGSNGDIGGEGNGLESTRHEANGMTCTIGDESNGVST
jgi:hypothetical protein